MLCVGLRMRNTVQPGSVGHRIAGGSGSSRFPGARPVAVSRGRGERGKKQKAPPVREREPRGRDGSAKKKSY
jgi:hypothetical protein